MTKDVIALTERMPDPQSLLAGLLAAGPELRLQTLADGAVLQLCDEQGRPLVSIETPILLQVPGEAARLLGDQAAAVGTPAWWVEARATTAAPHAERLAGAFASRLTAGLGGLVWPPEAAVAVPAPATDAAGDTALTPGPAAAPGHPAVDVLTDRVAVVMQDRPVVAMTSWLSDALRTCLGSGRGLQIVTPAHCRLTLATRTLLSGTDTRWVVRDEAQGYYDGLSGAVLRWQDGAFQPVDAPPGETPVARAFVDLPDHGETQLILSLRTLRPADNELVLGGALETVWRTLTGQPPVGWGTAEPVSLPWSRRELTDLAHRRSPTGTWAVVVGTPEQPAVATVRVARTVDGVEEDVTLVLGYPAGEQPPLEGIPALATELVCRHDVQSLLVQRRAARRDLTVPAHFEAVPIPVGFAIGPDAVHRTGLEYARRPPIPGAPLPLGPTGRPGLLYPLGDGTTAGAWSALQLLMRHLRDAPTA